MLPGAVLQVMPGLCQLGTVTVGQSTMPHDLARPRARPWVYSPIVPWGVVAPVVSARARKPQRHSPDGTFAPLEARQTTGSLWSAEIQPRLVRSRDALCNFSVAKAASPDV